MHSLPLRTTLVAMLLIAGARSGSAQQTNFVGGRYEPLNQYAPPGTVSQWAIQAGRICPQFVQQVRIHLPTEGTLTGYNGAAQNVVRLAAPAQMGLLVGGMYRFKLDNIPEFPNQDFYPTVELIDRLHPPPGQEARFPVEIEILLEELNWAALGRMVTKVVYLEQPDRVPLRALNPGEPRVIDLAPAQNALGEADLLGRPIAIVRMGGRLPDANAPDPQFWGTLLPIQVPVAMPADAASPSVTKVQPSRIKFGPPVVDFRTTLGPGKLGN